MQGIGVCAGLEVIPVAGITGNYHTDFAAKGRAAVEPAGRFDFLYIHVEAPDESAAITAGQRKIWSIEQIDEKIILPVLEYLRRKRGAVLRALHARPRRRSPSSPNADAGAVCVLPQRCERPGTITASPARRPKTGVFTKEACMLMPRLLEE